ncbi:MAG: response regulator [Opitutaceae bacterium]|nr:response regulator [Opitutaceae bacterium]
MIPVTTPQDLSFRTAKPLTIVVADDVEEITFLAKQWLEDAGHTVICAAGGDEVVRLMRDRKIDLVITDVLMPDGDGLDVLLAAKRMSPETKILAISGGGKYMTAGECLRIAKGIGANQVLLKPFNRVQLVAEVERLGTA